jgi:hypothetical protein
MNTYRPIRIGRRALIGAPALAVAAVALIARPAQAKPRTRTFECAADLMGAS